MQQRSADQPQAGRRLRACKPQPQARLPKTLACSLRGKSEHRRRPGAASPSGRIVAGRNGSCTAGCTATLDATSSALIDSERPRSHVQVIGGHEQLQRDLGRHFELRDALAHPVTRRAKHSVQHHEHALPPGPASRCQEPAATVIQAGGALCRYLTRASQASPRTHD